jgi:cytochrome P450
VIGARGPGGPGEVDPGGLKGVGAGPNGRFGHVSGDFDPFEAKDRLVGIGGADETHATLASLRAKCPVGPGSLSGRFGAEGVDTLLYAEDEQATTLSFRAAEQVLKDPTRFSASWYANVFAVVGKTMIEMDTPEHQRYRNLIQPAFTKKVMDAWGANWVRDLVDGIIDGFVEDKRAELSHQFAFDYPMRVIARAAGVAGEKFSDFHRDSVIMFNQGLAEEPRRAAAERMGAHIQRMIAERRDSSGSDLVSVLLRAQVALPDGRMVILSDEEVVAFVRLLVPSGSQTVYRGITNTLFGLLTHPEQLEAVRKDRSLIPVAIEEGLRWEPPVVMTVRQVTASTEIDGVPLPAEGAINVCLAAGNRDHSRWSHPEEFDIGRNPQGHLSFGAGPHICLGIHMARMEMRVAIEALLDRLPNLRLDPTVGPTRVTGLHYRTADRLAVIWD